MSLQDEISTSIKPGDDFYAYVNQKWQAEHPIPDDKASVSAFSVLNDTNIERLKALLETPADNAEPINLQRLKAFYRSAIDEDAIESNGLAAVEPLLAAIADIKDPEGLHAYITDCHANGRSMLWRADIDIDDKDSQNYTALIGQSGLGLPNRDYYFETGEKFESTRAAYKTFLADLFTLLQKDDVPARVDHVFELETALAKLSKSPVAMRDIQAKYNPFSHDGLASNFPNFDWLTYLNATDLAASPKVIINNPDFITGALKLTHDLPIEQWQDYALVRSITPLLAALPKAYADLHFKFYGTTLSGTKVMEARYKRMIKLGMALLPEPTGQLFVSEHFDETAKAAIEDLVAHIKTALTHRIDSLDWMSDVTKQKAHEKLATFTPLLGYPEKWRDYSDLQLGKNHVANLLALTKFEHIFDTKRLGAPVDRREWFMSPALVNAQYAPSLNSITFPAAILQPPFFDATGDFAANYGSIGVVIGHEISHGFDDQGAQFDKDGNLESWWTDADLAAFMKRTEKLKLQYDAYEIDGQHVQGGLTLGENIGDLGGMLIAYDALKAAIAETGQTNSIDGFTHEQRFFIAEARSWRANDRPEMVHRQIATDPHSPDYLRVNGVITNIDAFYDAFGVQPGEALYQAPADRVRIW